jgi:SAM-dependent methyltransferase
MSHGEPTIQDLGCTTSLDVIKERIPLAGLFVIDVGCGDMAFSRQLVDAGARVLAVDPDPVQAERNRAAAPVEHLAFVESGAGALPAPDATADGVFYSFSLHHVPANLYAAAFAEVVRVLKPDGFLCVIEPTASPLNEVMKLFHDEDRERAAAQDALSTLAAPAFAEHEEYTYHSFIEYESFDAYAQGHGGKSFNSGYAEADVRRPEVEAAFERLGAPDYRFASPKSMRLFRGLRTPQL